MSALDGFARGNAICLGVEHLPPEGSQDVPLALPSAFASQDNRPASSALAPSVRPIADTERGRATTASTPREDELLTDTALRFLEDLQGKDLKRLRNDFQSLNLPVAGVDEQSPGIPLRADERNAEDLEQRIGEQGHQIFRRPMQKLLRRSALVSRMEVRISDLAEFDSERRAVEDADDDVDLGRLTMVVRPNRLGDPVEIGYRRNGFVVSSSQQQLKCAYTLPITETLSLELRARQLYLDDSWQLRTEVRWQCSRSTRVHLVFGEDLTFPGEGAPYAQDPSAPSGVPGIQLFAVHSF